MPLPSAYEPKDVEARLYASWRERGLFRPDPDPNVEPFCVVLPPPNVTGRLHMGHALTATIEDTLVRWRRMSGFAALWLPGTDHAGIATQVMVERQLEKEGKDRVGLGRDAFLERVWAWKHEHGGIIDEQHAALGCSLDWERYRFTMDEVSSKAVREAFCRLHDEGLVYRAYRLINWDWDSQTALSDLEVEHREVAGSLWHLAYPVEGTDEKLVVATTRPETMLGDTAVAVHPEDPRYRHLVGKHVVLPLTGRRVPIVGDAILVDMEFGTGAVKVTPAHDFNDFETGKRHGLEVLCVLDLAGRINDNAPERFRGLGVGEARDEVVRALEEAGALVKVEPHALAIGFSQRTGVAVEPMPSTQWFVAVQGMAAAAVAAVRAGKTAFVPEHRTNDFYRWMQNIHDWCISRQLWWGHRIPAWYCEDGHVTVLRTDPTACATCGATSLRQDEDVLDTWFSSGLWPLTTLGWPDREDDLRRFYPTSLMETGWDILFFWVARMMMFGLHFRGEVPFRHVFLHSMVLGEDGSKMSKTRGNVVDPIELIDEYGADALRFYLCTMAGQELGIVFSRARVEGYRNFCNKLWNAARFAEMNLEGTWPARADAIAKGDTEGLSSADRWILARALEVAGEVERHIEGYRLDLAAHAAYRYVWYEVCDWYLELAKPSLRGSDEAREAARATLGLVLDFVLRVLHPMIPFVTEEIWNRLPKRPGSRSSLMIERWPNAASHQWSGLRRILEDAETIVARQEITRLMDAVTTVRAMKAQFKISPRQPTDIFVMTGSDFERELVRRIAGPVQHLTGSLCAPATSSLPREAAVEVVRGWEYTMPLEGLVDVAAERKRLAGELAKHEADIAALERKLGNPGFLAKAPPAVVEGEQTRLGQLAESRDKLKATLVRLA